MEKINALIETLKNEQKEYENLMIPEDFMEKKNLFRSLLNVRMPGNIPTGFVRLQDGFLQNERNKKGIVRVEEIPSVKKVFDSNVPFGRGILQD